MLVVTLGLAIATPAQATTVSECTYLIEVVKGELAGVEIGGNNPDRTRESLESKLEGARLKLDQAKFCDAITKLGDFKDKVTVLAEPNRKGETKIDADDAQTLADGAGDAIACIQELDPSC